MGGGYDYYGSSYYSYSTPSRRTPSPPPSPPLYKRLSSLYSSIRDAPFKVKIFTMLDSLF